MFNKLGLALGMVLNFYNSVVKKLTLKVGKFLVLNLKSVEVTGRNLVERLSLISFNRVKERASL